jgi:hypothetical protein
MPDQWQFRPFHITATQATAAAIGNNVATTSATTIVAGNGVVVIPASMANITVGRMLNFNGGTGAAEDALVKSVTSTTFTADFVNNHSGGYTISSQRVVDIGHAIIGQAGTGVVITLYDGHPSASPAGTAFSVISPNAGEPTREYNARCNRGLFYTLSGTPGDYTVTFHDRSA